MASKNQLVVDLTTEQIEVLVEVITEQGGSVMPEEELVESIRVVLEDVPGFDLASNRSIQCVINRIRNLYYGIRKN